MDVQDIQNASLERIINYDDKEKFLTALICFGYGAGYINIIDYIEKNDCVITKTSMDKFYKFNESDSQKIKSLMNK